MLKDQGLEASALNRLLVQRATFTPVKLHAALLYAELEYMRKHRQDYPLQTSRALSTLLRHRSDFLECSKEFRHGILHPSDQSVRSETVWVESGFSNELPIVQREVDAILGEMEQTLRSDVEQRLLGLPELLRWHCNARFLHWVCDDDAVLLNDERFKELTEALGRLDDEYERIGRGSEPPEFSPSVIGQGNRLVRCMTNLHHQFVALSPSDEGHTQPGFRPTFLKRFEHGDGPQGVIGTHDKHLDNAIESLGSYGFLVDAADILLNEIAELLPSYAPSSDCKTVDQQIVTMMKSLAFEKRQTIASFTRVGLALLHGLIDVYRNVCVSNPGLRDQVIENVIGDDDQLYRIQSFRHVVFHVASVNHDPYEVDQLASDVAADQLFTGFSTFLGSLAAYQRTLAAGRPRWPGTARQ